MIRSTTFTHWFSRRAVPAIVSIIALIFIVTTIALLHIGFQLDRQSAERAEVFINHALNSKQSEIERTLRDYAAWGAGYTHMHPKVDVDWVYGADNAGSTLYREHGLNFMFVIGPDGSTNYAQVSGELSDEHIDDVLDGGVEELIERARESGRQTSPVTSMLMQGSNPVLASAAVISPGKDHGVEPLPGPSSILILGYTLSPARLAAIGVDMYAPELRLGDLNGVGAKASMPVFTADGSHMATLAWTPERPGLHLMRNTLPWLAAAALLIATLTFLALRHAFQTATLLDRSGRKLAEAHAKAEHLAMHDVVTGLPNRAMLMTRLDMLLNDRRNGCTTVLYIDLDRFKPVNDLFGHEAGDRALIEVSHRLKSAVRESDLVARVGGDEFIIATTSIACIEDAEGLCRRLRECVEQPIGIENSEVQVGISIGVAIAPQDATTSEELLRHADTAMYQAKADGRGGHRFYSQEMNLAALTRRALEIDIRRAIDNREFELHFQPRFDTATLKIRGIEALMRWRHPQRGLIQPAEFIPVAEDSGLIVRLDTWALKEACRTAVRHTDIHVSVNLSPVHFRRGDVIGTVTNALAESGLPAHRLELEITENVLIDDTERARSVLDELKKIGVNLAMDDFGTGYSSLGYLQRFSFDRLKIDRSFVAAMPTDSGSRSIVQAILGLARALGVEVTAEGVETAEQYMLLRAEGCPEVQGYLFARPMPAHDLQRFIEMPAEELREIGAA